MGYNSRSKSRHHHPRSKRTLEYHMIIHDHLIMYDGDHMIIWWSVPILFFCCCWNRGMCGWLMVGQVCWMPRKKHPNVCQTNSCYQHTCLLLLLGERAPVLSWKKSGQANQYLLCPSQGTKQWCNLRFNIYFLGEHLGSAGLQRELIHANPTRSERFPERFCIFWLAQVTTPCNFSRSSTFKVPLQLQDPLKKNQFIEQNAPWHQRLSIVNVFGQYLQFLKSSWGWDEDELEMLMHLNRRKCGAY